MIIFWGKQARRYNEKGSMPLNYITDNPKVFYIDDPCVNGNNEGCCDCGILDTSTKSKNRNTILWRYVKINSVQFKSTQVESIYFGLPDRTSYTYMVDVEIFPKDYNNENSIHHTFQFKDNVVNFILLILNNINEYIECGFDINKLDIGILDNECSVYDFDDENHKLLSIQCSTSSIDALYDIIGKLEICGYRRSINWEGKDNSFWDEVQVSVNTDNRYFVKLLKRIISYGEYVNGVFKYTFEANHHTAFDAAYDRLLNDEEVYRYKKDVIRYLRISTIRLYDKNIALFENMSLV